MKNISRQSKCQDRGGGKMAGEHDGWVVKSFFSTIPTLLPWTFALTRKGAIQNWGLGWKQGSRLGRLKVVKVKLIEVEVK